MVDESYMRTDMLAAWEVEHLPPVFSSSRITQEDLLLDPYYQQSQQPTHTRTKPRNTYIDDDVRQEEPLSVSHTPTIPQEPVRTLVREVRRFTNNLAYFSHIETIAKSYEQHTGEPGQELHDYFTSAVSNTNAFTQYVASIPSQHVERVHSFITQGARQRAQGKEGASHTSMSLSYLRTAELISRLDDLKEDFSQVFDELEQNYAHLPLIVAYNVHCEVRSGNPKCALDGVLAPKHSRTVRPGRICSPQELYLQSA